MSRYLVSQAERSHKDLRKKIITPHNESLGRLWSYPVEYVWNRWKSTLSARSIRVNLNHGKEM